MYIYNHQTELKPELLASKKIGSFLRSGNVLWGWPTCRAARCAWENPVLNRGYM